LSAYLYYEFVSHYTSLISIGLISFVSVAQFAPAVFGGLYWKSGNKFGALSGIIIGFVVWFFTLIVPSLAQNNILSRDIIDYGLFHLSWLKPNSLFGLDGWGSIAHASFWSLLFNFGCYIIVSVWTNQTEEEKAQAELFVDIFKYSEVYESSVVYKGVAYIPDVKALLANFVGDVRANNLINAFSKRHKIENDISAKADPRMVAFVERTLSGIVGSASSRLMVATVVKEEEVSVQELMGVLKESQNLIALNNELKRKTFELNNTKSVLEETNRKLIQLDELKDDFLTTVTHELRTPITSIRAFSEILYDNPDMELEDRQHYTNIITRETERITRLIAQVLDLEKYESGRQKLHLTRFDLYDIVINVIEGMQQLVTEKQVNINVAEFSYVVVADEDKITQVLINLISNAVKFVPQNTGEITIDSTLDKGLIKLVVSDNGKGIDPQFHELIFDKFYQAENQTIRKPKGSGLGLAICKKIMQLHGGDISLRSILGEGSEFTIVFPIKREN
jgi:signal transduction histidine kinase